MDELTIRLVRLKYALESLEPDEQEKIVEQVENIAAKVNMCELESDFQEEIKAYVN